MHVLVEKNIIDTYPDLKIFSFIVELNTQEKIQIDNIDSNLILPDSISNIPVISQWRGIYRHMGIKPTKYYSSIEALLKRYKKGNWRTGNHFIDLYNNFSIHSMAPMGAYDCDKLQELKLRFARKNDIYHPLHSTSDFEIDDSKIVYAQFNKIACWAINHRDSEEFCVTSQTSKVLIVSEGFTIEQAKLAEQAITNFHNFYESRKYKISKIFTHIVA